MPWGVTYWPVSAPAESPPAGPTVQQTIPPLKPLDGPDQYAYKALGDFAQYVSPDTLKPIPGPTVQQTTPLPKPLDGPDQYAYKALQDLAQSVSTVRFSQPNPSPPLVPPLLQPAPYPSGPWPVQAAMQTWLGPTIAISHTTSTLPLTGLGVA